ncbi:ATP-binding protein [Mycobacterium sp. 1274756.6]|uniref:sensor histidine kinase n=1 Tax=Mycobacterium sp. 1274756.6 TaxID=1834076 RepID=UPI0007FEC48C|nr:ATP-binding protein [Mycobacterium sp. 1274756.6]OBJ72495.1 two-component sensor histidine kinase [Mycobacterium sp. 1274756.6]
MTRAAPWWRPRSLRSQLVIGVCAVVSTALLAVGLFSVLSLRSSVTAITDAELARSLAAFSHAYADNRGQATPEQLTHFVGQAPGNLIAVLDGDRVLGSAVFSDGAAQPAEPAVIAALEAQHWVDGPARTVGLDSDGSYRVQSRTVDGHRLVSAVSLKSSDQLLAVKVVVTVVIFLIALAATALGAILVVGYALRPLRRVAATAADVAALPLADPDRRITARVPVEPTDPEEVGIVGSTLNRLLDNVDAALADLAAADRRMRRFLADVSHELRTPLAVIQGYAELTRQDSAQLPPNSEYSLARIEAEAHRMVMLVEDLLLLSRLDEGQDLRTEDIDLGDLVIDAVHDAAVTGPEHTWTTGLPDEPVWIRGDRHRIHQLVSNLLSNARLHTPAGVTVHTAVVVDGGWVELTVTDDGPDIDAELLPHLFDRFVQADVSRSRTAKGSGLGLPIVAAIIEAHRGVVAAESGGGRTAFRVRLPLRGR